ncbi:MAG: DnaA N-terminal domain-containing protein [Rickettsia sp.]|uniref:DnaA N-terminal domain-containing protein n=1 Tax=Rickettsia sp. TaxID=789 RepID=UPI00397826CE
MNLLSTQSQLPILPNNPEAFSNFRQKQNSKELIYLDNKQYIPIIPCLFEVILKQYSNKLSPRDIVFFSQVLALYQAALSKNQKSIIYSSEKIAVLLGYKTKNKNNMRSIALRITKKLEQIGLLQVTRGKTKKGTDKINEIIPLLPDDLYESIKYAPNKHNEDSSRFDYESNLEHILRSKPYVPITIEFAKSLFDNPMSNKYKLFFLNCLITAYKNYQITGNLSFSATSCELLHKNNISKRTLFNILQYIKNQTPNFFITVENKYIRSDDSDSNRWDKSIFTISIAILIIPYSHIQNFDDKNKNQTVEPDTYAGFRVEVQIWKPSNANLEAIIKKNKEKKISIKNIDEKNEKPSEHDLTNPSTLEQTSNLQHLENDQRSFSSKSLKNTIKNFMDALPLSPNIRSESASKTIKDISEKESKKIYYNSTDKTKVTVTPTIKTTATKILDIAKSTSTNTTTKEIATTNKAKISRIKRYDPSRTLKYYYPLTKEEVSSINWSSGREFSTNYGNQLMLKLISEKAKTNSKFPTRSHMKNYMIKAFRKEKRQGLEVNHETYRLKYNLQNNNTQISQIGNNCNNVLDIQKVERYLTAIENNYDTSYEMQLKRKIAVLFENIKAYEILVNSKFSYLEGFFKLTFFKNVILCTLQQEVLKNAIKSVYGNSVNIQILTGSKPKADRTHNNYFKSKKELSVGAEEYKSLSNIDETTSWYFIRQGLIQELGYEIDKAWFSKARVKEDKEMKTLTLSMPTKFMTDWINSRYGHIVYRLAQALGFKFIEYTD